MKVLFFNAYYEPEVFASSYLCRSLCEELAANGFEVELYTPIPTRGVSNEVRKAYRKNRQENKYNGRFKIHRVYLPRESKKTIFRALRYIWMNIIYIFLGLRTKADLIFLYSTPPTQGMMGIIIKKIKKVPVIYNIQDIFPDSLVDAGISKQDSMLVKIGAKMEDITYQNIDKVIVISRDFQRNIINKGAAEEKIDIVYNWVDENQIIPIERKSNILFEKFNLPRDKFFVVYAGNLGFAQDIDLLLDTAKLLETEDEIQFVIIGNGALEEQYKKRAADLQLRNAHFLPLQPYSEVSYVYSLGDVSIVSCKPGYGKSAMPSKTWSIMSAGRPVLASFDEDTDLQNLIQENRVGLFVKAGSAEFLKEAVLYLFDHQDECLEMGKNARSYILNNLTSKIGTEKIIASIKSVVGDETLVC